MKPTTRAVAATGLLVSAAEALFGIATSQLPEPAIWHDNLVDRKHEQMRRLSWSGGADIVIGGDSHGVHGIHPVQLGELLNVRVYNAAIYRGMPSVNEEWLLKVALPLLRPRLLVYNFAGIALNDGGTLHRVITSQYLASRGHSMVRGGHWLGEYLRTVHIRQRAFYLRKPRAVVTAVLEGLRERRSEPVVYPCEEKLVGELGNGLLTEARSYMTTERMRHVIEVDSYANYSSGGYQSRHLSNIVAYCRARDIDVVFVHMPTTQFHRSLYPESYDEDRFRGMLAEFAESVGALTIDDSRDFEDDYELFADLAHLNARGKALFTERLAESLQRLGHPKERRPAWRYGTPYTRGGRVPHIMNVAKNQRAHTYNPDNPVDAPAQGTAAEG